MDDIVKQALAKWPNVPHCYGWLGLDARGQWWLRDEQAQACGAFASGVSGARGSLVQHEKLMDFIGRNYMADLAQDDGRWFFQNGPQRVYVELEATPWIWRLHCTDQGLQLRSHTGQVLQAADIEQVLMDEQGHLYLGLPQGLGLVHTQDMVDAATAMERGWLAEPQVVQAAQLPARFGFVPSPQPAQA